MDKKSEIDNSILRRSVGELVQKAFEQFGGIGDSEPVILRSMNTPAHQFEVNKIYRVNDKDTEIL